MERMREVRCWNCGTELTGREKYCKECGAQLQLDAQWQDVVFEDKKTMRVPSWEERQRQDSDTWRTEPIFEAQPQQTCRVCGSPLSPDAAFCNSCGTEVAQKPTAKPRRRHRVALAAGIVAAVVVIAVGGVALLYRLGFQPLPQWIGRFFAAQELQTSDSTVQPSQGGSTSEDDAPWLEHLPEEDDTLTVQPSADETKEPSPTPEETPEQPAVDPTVQEELQVPSPVESLENGRISDLVSAHAPKAAWSVAVLDLEDETCYSSQTAGEGQSASAMVMIPVLYTIAAQADDGALALNTPIPITQNLGGRTQLANQVGKSVEVETLMRYMLQYSDNIATNTLLEALGFSTVEDVCRQAGFSSVTVANYLMATEDYTTNDNYVSAEDLCGMLAALYGDTFSAFGRDFLRQYMHLQDDTVASGLLNAAPSDVSTLNLNGQKTDKYNEVAIFDDGAHAYVVAFLGHGDSLERLQQAAKEVGSYCIETLQIGA